MTKSNQWNHFRLDRAWWTTLLQQHRHDDDNYGIAQNVDDSSKKQILQQRAFKENLGKVRDAAESSEADFKSHLTDDDVKLSINQSISSSVDPAELLPDRVSLSSGAHKYVLIRATYACDRSDDNDETTASRLDPKKPYPEQWFVKSASPEECGGFYHGNVAQDLVEWIQAAGYHATVMGGGRIDYRPSTQRVYIYGFSYGFGRADHEQAARLIRSWKPDLTVTVDNTEGMY